MRIALLGTRGVPAQYGGFETAVEEVGMRLAAMGHEVTVYARGRRRSFAYRGMNVVQLPAVNVRSLETLIHSGFATAHALSRNYDVVILFNAANSPYVPLLKMSGAAVAVHVDGLEWRRQKWGRLGRAYYLRAERLAVAWADALIADAKGIADYYHLRYQAETTLLTYGAPIRDAVPEDRDRLARLGLLPQGYMLVVARLEPENHVDMIVQGYRQGRGTLPLVVVGANPYPTAYSREVVAVQEDNVRFVGSVWDQELLDALYANTALYFHGHSVGGTNPSLLRAMGAAAPVAVYDVDFNLEIAGLDAPRFSNHDDVARLLSSFDAEQREVLGRANQARVSRLYTWPAVASGYEELCRQLTRK